MMLNEFEGSLNSREYTFPLIWVEQKLFSPLASEPSLYLRHLTNGVQTLVNRKQRTEWCSVSLCPRSKALLTSLGLNCFTVFMEQCSILYQV